MCDQKYGFTERKHIFKFALGNEVTLVLMMSVAVVIISLFPILSSWLPSKM